MRLSPSKYNSTINHCPGGRQRACKNCLRYVLFRTWCAMPPADRTVIALVPPTAVRSGCRDKVYITSTFKADGEHPAKTVKDAYNRWIAI